MPIENEPPTPTFVPETQLSHRETRVDLENVQIADVDVEGTKKRIIWKKEEDELLARSYVTMSDDPVIAIIRRGMIFGDVLQKKVNRFNANYNSVYNTYRSGHSDEDILQFAYEKYRDENNGVAFNLEHVWRIMKTRPLFIPQSDDHLVGTKKARISESGASNTSSNKDASVDFDINEEEIRPIGQKAAKRKEEMKAKAALNKSEAKKSKYLLKEYEILSKDTSQMTPEQLIVHEHLCDQIREKWNM
ncbi:glutathione S-transferase T3-like [Primulina tabacum]|uniref:glutathione S-transferase T3-like n=1 Tax=Primulina tabacum TaxID=48773 RepID=UPI003F5A7854